MKKFWIVKFLFRAFLGIGIILMMNQILDNSNYFVSVKTNFFSLLTSGFLGIPGVMTLYGIALYSFL